MKRLHLSIWNTGGNYDLPNGWRIVVTIETDDTNDTPWEREDGHGPVRHISRFSEDDKRPGERILWRDRGEVYLYDFAGAINLAKKDQWGCRHSIGVRTDSCGYVFFNTHRTKGEMRACAVEADFNRLRGFLNDQWCYVGVIVTLFDEDEQEIVRDSLWGIESDSYDFLEDESRSMAARLIVEARESQRLAALEKNAKSGDALGVAAFAEVV